MIDIDKLAESVGMIKDGDNWFSSGSDDFDVKHEHLVALMNLVAAAERESFAQHCVEITRKAVAFEREACAAICDRFQARDVGMQPAECAGAIRARGQHELP